MSIRKGDTVIAGAYNLEKVQDGVARKNVGDVFWTMRKDTSNDGINGAYDCNGREFLSTDFQGDQSPYTLLVEGLLPSVTYEQYEQELTNNNGNCGYFALDTTAQKFKVPTYSEISILSGNLQDIGKYIPDGVPETALGSITLKGNVQSNGIAQLNINESGYNEQSYSNDIGLLSQEPTTEANVTLGNEVDQVKPKTITLRAMIQLATRGQDISIKQYTDQLDGLVEDAQESANLAQQAAVNAAITLKGEYSTETTYGMNNAVTVTTEEGTQYYVSLVADNLNNPVTDTTKWAPWIFIPLVQDGSNGLGVDIGTIITSLKEEPPVGFSKCEGETITQQQNSKLYESCVGVYQKATTTNFYVTDHEEETTTVFPLKWGEYSNEELVIPSYMYNTNSLIWQPYNKGMNSVMGSNIDEYWLGNKTQSEIDSLTPTTDQAFCYNTDAQCLMGYENSQWSQRPDIPYLFIPSTNDVWYLDSSAYILSQQRQLPVVSLQTIAIAPANEYAVYPDTGIVASHTESTQDNVIYTTITFASDVKILGMNGLDNGVYNNTVIDLSGKQFSNLYMQLAGAPIVRYIIVNPQGEYFNSAYYDTSSTSRELTISNEAPDPSYYTGPLNNIYWLDQSTNTIYLNTKADTGSFGEWVKLEGYGIACIINQNTSNVITIQPYATETLPDLNDYEVVKSRSNGNCGYFGVDESQQLVKLPTLNKIFLEADNTNIGMYSQDQIVNITGNFQSADDGFWISAGLNCNGAFEGDRRSSRSRFRIPNSTSFTSETRANSVNFDASTVVNTGDRVKPRSIGVNYYVCTSAFEQVASGATFTPEIQTVEEGVELSWTNDKGLANPASVVIPKGQKGDTGDIGPSNVLTIGTVQSGETAGATITGTSPSQTLNLTLPQGEKGDKGDKGNNGVGFDIGTVFSSLNCTPPDGCNATDGTEVTKQNYPDLYNACTTTMESITRYELVDATQFITKINDTTLQVASVKFSDGTIIPSKQITDYNGASVVIVNAVDNEWQLVCTQGYTGVGMLVSDTIPAEPVNTNYGYWTYCKLDGYVYAYNNSTNWSLSGGTTFEKQIYCPGVFDVPNNQPMQANGVTYTINTTVQVEPKLPVCTYEEYETYLTNNNGNCGYFGVDTANEKIKLPTLDKVFLEVGNTDIGSYSQDQIVNLSSPGFDFGSGSAGATGGGVGLPSSGNIPQGAKYALRPVDPTIRMQYKNIATGTKVVSSGIIYRTLQLNAAWQVNTGDRVKPRSIAMYFYVCLEKFTAMERGVTFTPSISEDGVISWTNDGGLVNPEPVSIKGTPGEISTLSIGTVEQGDTTSVTISGQAPNQVLNFVLQKGNDGQQGEQGEQGPVGPSNTLTIGEVTSGSTASAEITGTSPNQVLNLVLPKGDKGDIGETGPKGETGATGPTNTLTIGTVEGGDTAQASITGQSPNQVLNLTLPKGEKGDTGDQGPQGEAAFTVSIGQVTTLQPTEQATVVNSGTPQSQIWDISIPKGDKGDSGVTIVTTISASSTDEEVPSAKCMWDLIGDIETLLSEV